MSETAITISQLSKSYGEVEAVQSIDLTVNQGELFGLIGPDGAGKSTIIRILTTLLLPDSGSASVLGLDVVDHYKILRTKMGYMPGRFSLYQDLSVIENLELFASIYETTVEENYHLIKDIYHQIEPFKNRKAGALSGGMKQKLALSCAMIHQPEILFLDEPTTGVDPVSRKEFWEMLKNLNAQDITILVSTPYMDEADQCNRIAFIQDGQIMAVDTPQNITSQFPNTLYRITTTNKYALAKDLEDYQYSHSVYRFGAFIHYTDNRGQINPNEVITYLENKGHQGIFCEMTPPGIEDTFIALMEKSHE